MSEELDPWRLHNIWHRRNPPLRKIWKPFLHLQLFCTSAYYLLSLCNLQYSLSFTDWKFQIFFTADTVDQTHLNSNMSVFLRHQVFQGRDCTFLPHTQFKHGTKRTVVALKSSKVYSPVIHVMVYIYHAKHSQCHILPLLLHFPS